MTLWGWWGGLYADGGMGERELRWVGMLVGGVRESDDDDVSVKPNFGTSRELSPTVYLH